MNKTVFNDGDEGVKLIVRSPKQKVSPPEPKLIELRSPVHVVYGGANLFNTQTTAKIASIAIKTLATYAPNFAEFAVAMGLKGSETLPTFPNAVVTLEKQLIKSPEKVKAENYPAWFAWIIHQRVINKLQMEPVEDFRIDFEDGYGFRPDVEEDKDAVAAAEALAESFLSGTNTYFCGFRVKSFAAETRQRAARTLKLFLDTFLQKTNGQLPANFVVTLPKISDKREVSRFCSILRDIEKQSKLLLRSIKIEIMIETPSAVIDKKGRVAIPMLVKAAKGRCVSAHFGAYDYTSALGISATHQTISHRSCSFAREMMLVSLAPLGIRVSDSVTTEIPVAPFRGDLIDEFQALDNKRAIYHAWRTHFSNVTRSMTDGFYQSWDLHPNQLPARFAAVFAFFIEEKDAQGLRLRNFVERATKATLTGTAFDDAASAQGILNFFIRAVSCGALSEVEVADLTKLSAAELRSGSFSTIMNSQKTL